MGLRSRVQNILWRGFLPGIRLGDWILLLRENKFNIGRRYWDRAASVTVGSVLNSVWYLFEMLFYGLWIPRTKYSPPLFVIGVMRSGTTHLFNMLAIDQRFAFPNYIQVMNPHTFLTSEWFFGGLMDAVAPKTRVLDNVEYGSKIPEEDEYALIAMTRLSFMLSGPFPQEALRYRRYLTFRSASEAEVNRWKRAIQYFVQKLTIKHRRPLILKSPGHTGRIRMILDVFPDAKFVYISRDPFEVYASYTQMVAKFSSMINLQEFVGTESLEDHTVNVYKELNDAFFEERDLIPKGHLCELSYENLIDNPIEQMRRVYEALDLPDFQNFEPNLKDYLASIADYRKNKRSELPVELQARLESEWGHAIAEWQRLNGKSPVAGASR